jgi:hypothetical protein
MTPDLYKSSVCEPLASSLWRCEVCETFVSIHSAQIVVQASCPICCDSQLKFCGSFDQIMGARGAVA